MKVSIFFIAALLILSCSSSMVMGVNYHEDHCHDSEDCEIWCKQYVPEPKCINHICNCKPPPSTDEDLPTSANSSNLDN
ncbi:hypothetical protein EUTSA_v10001109mg [Eutrema salsugineum]|uniref:Knottin scorpion toxin-like domain-containing protein n=1 Tax=Eutrema salsugineum TaxID=72664 RepID=V4KPK3_EUTSA|nr:defensin-like protein 308 [Eutrema salsugineum]ESQ39835.1 hypothetical protein EUTSA_v10001109mg [Eutrema salsugineum]